MLDIELAGECDLARGLSELLLAIGRSLSGLLTI